MIDKLTFAVGDMEPMVNFYSALLGVELNPVEMFERTLYAGRYEGIELLFCPRDLAGVEAGTNTIQLRFIVPDARVGFDRGKASGGLVISEPTRIGEGVHASLRDPDGNSLEIQDRTGDTGT